ncbi:MAG: alpha-E domain-containing protein [Pseudomonadota bacterium]
MALLSRTAENLFWIGRYIERAENMARLLEAGKRMSATPDDAAAKAEWEAVLAASGVLSHFSSAYDTVDQDAVVDFVAYSPANPSSIYSCVKTARENARAVRTAFTIDMWSALNEFWLEFSARPKVKSGDGGLMPFLEWVKRSTALFRGVTESTQLRLDCYDFLRLGVFIERADCTARILDVKNFAFHRKDEPSDGVEAFHWTAILRATSSLRSFNWAYGGGIDAEEVADFLVLNPYCARSLRYSMGKVTEHLDRLARLYADRHDCHEICASLYSDLTDNKIEDLIENGLHDFLTKFIARNNWLSAQISRDYHFASALQPPHDGPATTTSTMQVQTGRRAAG